MNDGASRPCLSAIFVDYDNIYLSLKRKNEEAAKRFAKNAGLWLKGIESGELIKASNTPLVAGERRVVLNRCYGNPVPRRSNKDNSTDMNSFPFIRHHFLRAGSEIVDCPPLTAQLKNSSDIRMVMDIRDLLNHDTYYDEFIILSGDADFTPVLHRLRAHARRTVIYANDHTAVPYTAISDAEIQENDLISLLINGHVGAEVDSTEPVNISSVDPEKLRTRIIDEITVAVSESDVPVPIESLADRAQRLVGHEQTIGTNWVGHGNFLTFLAENLPEHIELTDQAPYLAVDKNRMGVEDQKEAVVVTGEGGTAHAGAIDMPEVSPEMAPQVQAAPVVEQSVEEVVKAAASTVPQSLVAAPPAEVAPSAPPLAQETSSASAEVAPAVTQTAPDLQAPELPATAVSAPIPDQQETQAVEQNDLDATSAIQRSIARIHDACQAPPLAPPEYKMLFELIALELLENNINGHQTIANIVARAREFELELKNDDARFIVDVISEADPWFEQGASADLFAGRFRNFVVARCRGQGLTLSVDELDLIDAWFAGKSAGGSVPEPEAQNKPVPMIDGSQIGGPADSQAIDQRVAQGGAVNAETADQAPIDAGQPMTEDELPRIVRSRMRG